MNSLLQEKIVKNLERLNSFQLTEVSDFIEFLNRRETVSSRNADIIDALCGKYRDQLSSSEEYSRRKREEIELEETKWRNK